MPVGINFMMSRQNVLKNWSNIVRFAMLLNYKRLKCQSLKVKNGLRALVANTVPSVSIAVRGAVDLAIKFLLSRSV